MAHYLYSFPLFWTLPRGERGQRENGAKRGHIRRARGSQVFKRGARKTAQEGNRIAEGKMAQKGHRKTWSFFLKKREASDFALLCSANRPNPAQRFPFKSIELNNIKGGKCCGAFFIKKSGKKSARLSFIFLHFFFTHNFTHFSPFHPP